MQNSNYKSPDLSNWAGRATSEASGKQYWHQFIECIDLNKLDVAQSELINTDIGLLGYACDEGVKRNLGRVGAVQGPAAFRERMGKLAYHHRSKTIADLGDVVCEDEKMEGAQAKLSSVVADLLKASVFPIVVGGGHDISYGHFKGIWEAVKHTSKHKIGIINFDAHFDLRPVEGLPNSGTPFNQILSAHSEEVEYFALGIQRASNTQELFEIADQYRAGYLYNYACNCQELDTVKKVLQPFISRNDWIYVTIDMDGFSSAYAPGVSAPSPTGFDPNFVVAVLEFLLESKKVISCDFAELSPRFDQDNVTASLVARLVDKIISEYTRSLV